jgi:hypothetical protein
MQAFSKDSKRFLWPIRGISEGCRGKKGKKANSTRHVSEKGAALQRQAQIVAALRFF